MKDGDLWELFTRLVLQRGPRSVKITKVKGHATEAMVQEGKVKLAEKQGNDRSDTAAALGVTESQSKVHAFGALYSARHVRYRAIMCRIQKYIVGLKEEERKLKQEAARQQQPFREAKERSVCIPMSLRYPEDLDADGTETPGEYLRMHPIHDV